MESFPAARVSFSKQFLSGASPAAVVVVVVVKLLLLRSVNPVEISLLGE
jgi:hypothetical protein